MRASGRGGAAVVYVVGSLYAKMPETASSVLSFSFSVMLSGSWESQEGAGRASGSFLSVVRGAQVQANSLCNSFTSAEQQLPFFCF